MSIVSREEKVNRERGEKDCIPAEEPLDQHRKRATMGRMNDAASASSTTFAQSEGDDSLVRDSAEVAAALRHNRTARVRILEVLDAKLVQAARDGLNGTIHLEIDFQNGRKRGQLRATTCERLS
jgi:hypothetical protein